jgi:hypothetical protein
MDTYQLSINTSFNDIVTIIAVIIAFCVCYWLLLSGHEEIISILTSEEFSVEDTADDLLSTQTCRH